MTEGKEISLDNIAGYYLDPEKNERLIFTRDQLINQLQKICPKIIKSFDEIYSQEFKNLSSELSKIMPIQFAGMKTAHKEKNELLITCGDLLRNASNTIVASTQLLRNGFRLQSGILIRSIIEICATVVHLLVKPYSLKDFLADKIKSTYSISVADKQIPLFGKIWGLISNHHIHINPVHGDWYPLNEFTDKNEIPVSITLGLLGLSTMMIRIVTELTFINEIEKPQYWKNLGKGRIKFIPPKDFQINWAEQLINKK